MINFKLLYYQLEQAGLPVVGVSSDGRIDYRRALTVAEEATAAQVIAAHDPNGLLPEEQNELDYRNKRQAAIAYLQNIADNWASLTNAQKLESGEEYAKILLALIKKLT